MKYFNPPSSDLVDVKFKTHWFEQSLVDKYNTYMDADDDDYIKDIISLLNATIKKVNIVGFTDSFVTQEQGGGFSHTTAPQLGTKSWVQGLSSKTVTLELHHVDAYMSYLFLWESFQRQYSANHKNTIKDSLDIVIKNTKRQTAFVFSFKDFLFAALDDIPLDSETTNNDFGTFELSIAFKIGSASVQLPTKKNPH